MSFDQSGAPSVSKSDVGTFCLLWSGRLKDFFLSPLFISILVALITLVIFSSVLGADFVRWDDDIIIYNNPNLRGLNLERLVSIFKDVDSMMRYNPLTLLGWSITYHFFGSNPFWYHFGNWLLHGFSAALVFLIIRKLLLLSFSKEKRAEINFPLVTISAAVAALVWSLHPLRVEPVAWATDRTYCQSLFFLLLSLLFYLRANEAGINIRRYFMLMTTSVVCYVISLLSYAVGMTFFVVFIVLDFYPLGRLGGKNGWRSVAARRALLEKVPFIAAALAVGFVTVSIRMASAGVWSKPVLLSEFGLIERAAQAVYAWAYYIWRPWYPVNLSPVYTNLVSFEPFTLPFIASGLGVAGGIIVLFLLRRRWPLGLALGICHLLILVPVLGLFEHPYYHNDRYSMVVSICWSVLLAAWLANSKMRRLSRSVVVTSLILAITVLSLLTFQQTRVWSNSVNLFEHMLKTLGDDPYSSDIYWRLGVVLNQQGAAGKAVENFEKSLEINPDFDEAHNSLAKALASQGRLTDAVVHFRQAVQINPGLFKAHFNLGNALKSQGKFEEAVNYYRRALQIRPGDAEVHNNLGVVLKLQGRFDEAISHYRQALQSAPGYAKAHNNLGGALLAQGRMEDAVKHFYQALDIRPDYVLALENLERILTFHSDSRLCDANEVIKYAERAAESTAYRNARVLKTLAAVYAAGGQFDKAITTVQAALDLAMAEQNSRLANYLRSQLRRYKQAKP